MPTLVLRWIVVEDHASDLASIFLKTGGRGGIGRTAQKLGVHRDTLLRGLKRRNFGPIVGQKIIDGLKSKHPDIDTKYMTFKCE